MSRDYLIIDTPDEKTRVFLLEEEQEEDEGEKELNEIASLLKELRGDQDEIK